jgi:release factor glutamine methyltransferase
VTRRELTDELTAGLGGARHEARFIVDEVLGPNGARGARLRPDEVPSSALRVARAMAARRAAGEPLQYVFGHWSFRHLDLLVDRRVLIPRPETEQVVEVALAEGRRLHRLAAAAGPGRGGHGARGLVAVDAGTGSGAIALALADELGPGVLREVWATDVSADALAVAAANLNAQRVPGAERPLARIELVEGSWLEPLPARLRGSVDLVVANPPYVSAAEWAGLADEVRAEPRRALVAGPSSDGTPGLADVEVLLEACRTWLGRPGCAVVELAPHQAGPAARLARRLGYDEVRVEADLAGRPRALVVRVAV